MVKEYVSNNAVIAFCRSAIIDENSQRTARNMQKHLKHSFCMRGKVFNGEYMSKVNSILNASSAVFSKDVALKIESGDTVFDSTKLDSVIDNHRKTIFVEWIEQ